MGLLLTSYLKYGYWESPTLFGAPLSAFAAAYCFGTGDSAFNTQVAPYHPNHAALWHHSSRHARTRTHTHAHRPTQRWGSCFPIRRERAWARSRSSSSCRTWDRRWASSTPWPCPSTAPPAPWPRPGSSSACSALPPSSSSPSIGSGSAAPSPHSPFPPASFLPSLSSLHLSLPFRLYPYGKARKQNNAPPPTGDFAPLRNLRASGNLLLVPELRRRSCLCCV